MSIKRSENPEIKNLNCTLSDEDKQMKLELLMGIKGSFRNIS